MLSFVRGMGSKDQSLLEEMLLLSTSVLGIGTTCTY